MLKYIIRSIRWDNWALGAGFAAVLFAAIVCSFLYAISYPPFPGERPITQSDNYASYTERQPPGNTQRNSTPIPPAITLIPAPKSEAESERDENERLNKAANERGLTVATWILAFATILLFLAVAIQAVLFIWQLRLIRDSLVEAKKASKLAETGAHTAQQQIELARAEFLSTHRPQIKIKAVFLMNEEITYEEAINVHVVCVNRGVTEAIIAEYGIDHLVIMADVPLPPDHKIPRLGRFAPTDGKVPTLASGISMPLPGYSFNLTDGEEVNIRSGRYQLYCLGYVHYWDAAGRTRLTQFCRRLEIGKVARTGRFVLADQPDYEYED